MKYELWDFETGNCSGVYRTLAAALDVVRGAVHRDGESTLAGLSLLAVTPEGDRHVIAEERELLAVIGVRAAAG
ncbi:MAG: hypothetical protein HYY42_04470 [Chloroflexi bacterium]|nr:hypothetical protein [Chloroflexota bacterium]